MKKIITLTMNPVVDKDTSVAGIVPNKKLRCATPAYFAGGGGINVSRALKKLGGDSLCMYLAGGPTGAHLQHLVAEEGIEQEVISIEGWTRENLSVTDTNTQLQYRFGVPGPKVKNEELLAILTFLEENLQFDDFMVVSGKLPQDVPVDFYVEISKIADKKNAKFILDTSGVALLPSMKANIYLMKPNLGEFSTIMGVPSISVLQLDTLAKKFLETYKCKVLVISLGAKGALWAHGNKLEHIPAPTVHQESAIGAGDSMVAGIVHSLSNEKSLGEAIKYGVACGTAATLHTGTQLCNKEDADKLYEWVLGNTRKERKKTPKLI
ncbi:1-phosphofructokinase family hexose kinase [Maribacter polysiphoniae]|uniref:1-phosphofructokinase family hexose kinase n=2 Tax=Maribacter polysiphoniae TaxID=429344 RepID=A0ABR7VW98_9FLAO|nr:1-phosphofructokinase family hexose kinase [Maribacter polysiphoniae]MBD1259749.1 1-phosphofructokinase family hexose kinase [Maribacter polysiphoniae]